MPGYDCRGCFPAQSTIPRQDGKLYQAGLAAVGPAADLVLIEGIDNVDENAHLLETGVWGRLYLRSRSGSPQTSPESRVTSPHPWSRCR
jgi:hypothetical protein